MVNKKGEIPFPIVGAVAEYFAIDMDIMKSASKEDSTRGHVFAVTQQRCQRLIWKIR